MKRFNGVKKISSSLGPLVITLGNFDGVHKGHQQLLKAARRVADNNSAHLMVYTFDPHPVQILQPERGLRKLFNVKDLEERLAQQGVDFLVVEPFNCEFSKLTPSEFIEGCLLKPLSPLWIVVGYDFAFGASRSGGIATLNKYADSGKFQLHVVEAHKSQAGAIFSSSQIRDFVAKAQMEEAEQALGRAFYLAGMVVEGDQRGRTLGFPTANIWVEAETLPPPGVYCTRTWVEGSSFYSVTNVGFKPTFYKEKQKNISVETFILDGVYDLYGKELKVEFLKCLRPELKFSGPDELINQIREDILKTRQFFGLDDEMGRDSH